MAKKKNQTQAPIAPTPAPIPPAPAPMPEAPKPVDAPAQAIPTYVRPAVVDEMLNEMPESTRTGFKGMVLPAPVVIKGKGLTEMPQTFRAWTDAAAMVLGETAANIVLAFDAALKAEVDAQVARIKADEARKEAERRAKMRTELDAAIKGIKPETTMAEVMKLATIAKEADCYLVIHGGEGNGSGIFLRQMGSKPVASPKPTGDAKPSDGKAEWKYFDETANRPIEVALSKYIRDTYPASHTVRFEDDLKARRDRGETQTRIAAWDQYQKGIKAGDTFVIRRDPA